MSDRTITLRPLGGIERVRLCADILLASLVGVAALAIAVEQPWLLFLTFGTIILLKRVWQHHTTRPDSATTRERVFIFSRLAGSTAISSLAGVIGYGVAYWIANTWGDLDPRLVASWFAAATFLTVDLLPLEDDEVEQAVHDLYPSEIGRLPITLPEAWTRFGRVLGVLVLSAVILIASSILFGPASLVTKVLWFILLLTNGALATPVAQYQATDDYQQAVQALADAMRDRGFTVTKNPATGDPKIDALLARIDLFADAPGYDPFLVDVRFKEPELSWVDATSVVTAAQVLRRQLDPKVAPSIVLVDSVEPVGLPEFADEVGLEVVHVDTIQGTTKSIGRLRRLDEVTDAYLTRLQDMGQSS
jgi:hypothetical protein